MQLRWYWAHYAASAPYRVLVEASIRAAGWLRDGRSGDRRALNDRWHRRCTPAGAFGGAARQWRTGHHVAFPGPPDSGRGLRLMWPFRKSAETRSSSGGFTNLYLESQLVRAEGTRRGDPSGLAALEAAAGFFRRAFQSAEIEGDPSGTLTPAILGHIAGQLIRRGQSLLEIRPDRLAAAGFWYWTGSSDPSTWSALITHDGPTDQTTRTVMFEDLIFCRYSYDPRTPWIGVGPLQYARRTGELAARLEASLADEAGAATGMILPFPERSLPEGGDDPEFNPLTTLTKQLAGLRGGLALAETVAGGHGDRSGAPQTDWVQRRLGPVFGDAQVELRKSVNASIYEACGVPMSIVDPASAASNREGFRQFLFGSVLPLARIIEGELTAKLGGEIKLSFKRLMASDVRGRARSKRLSMRARRWRPRSASFCSTKPLNGAAADCGEIGGHSGRLRLRA